MSTSYTKASQIKRNWVLIDAKDLILGRMAVNIANILRGKNKPFYTPHVDCGDNVIVINADKVVLTGKKMEEKRYYWHTGYPGGIKSRTMKQLAEEPRNDRMIYNSVRRMMNKGPLTRQIMKKLKVYKGAEHPHIAQNPETIDLKSMNAKNIRRS